MPASRCAGAHPPKRIRLQASRRCLWHRTEWMVGQPGTQGLWRKGGRSSELPRVTMDQFSETEPPPEVSYSSFFTSRGVIAGFSAKKS